MHVYAIKKTWFYEMRREIYCNGKDYWMKMSCQKPCAGVSEVPRNIHANSAIWMRVQYEPRVQYAQQCNMINSAIWNLAIQIWTISGVKMRNNMKQDQRSITTYKLKTGIYEVYHGKAGKNEKKHGEKK